MMAAAEMVFWLLTAATLQALLPTWGHLGEPEFPVLLGVVLYVAVHKKPGHFIWTATVAGVLDDALSLAPFGCSSVAFLAGGGLAMLLAGEGGEGAGALEASGLGAAGAAAATGVMGGLLRWKGLTGLGAGGIACRMAGSALLAAVTVPVLFALLRRMERGLGTAAPEEGRG